VVKVKTPCEKSCELMCANLKHILAATESFGVPLGINVESVSGFRDEIDATHMLYRSLQGMMLDGTGGPWVMRWSRADASLASGQYRRRSSEQDEKLPGGSAQHALIG
jgi:hypothetical protein